MILVLVAVWRGRSEMPISKKTQFFYLHIVYATDVNVKLSNWQSFL